MNEDFVWVLGAGGLNRPTWYLKLAKYPNIPVSLGAVTTLSQQWVMAPHDPRNDTWFSLEDAGQSIAAMNAGVDTSVWTGLLADARRRVEERFGLEPCLVGVPGDPCKP